MNQYERDPSSSGHVLHPRVWRHDQGAMFAGICAGLAEDLDLPLPLIRLVAVLFLILPTGLAYLALGLLLRRRPVAIRSGIHPSGAAGQRPDPRPAAPVDRPVSHNWALLQHRFAVLEPRLARIESVVTSNDFELHRDFRRMEG